jgi:hypothetical protein
VVDRRRPDRRQSNAEEFVGGRRQPGRQLASVVGEPAEFALPTDKEEGRPVVERAFERPQHRLLSWFERAAYTRVEPRGFPPQGIGNFPQASGPEERGHIRHGTKAIGEFPAGPRN